METKPVSTCDIIDIEGITVGHHTDHDAFSGVTAVLCPDGAVCGVDVRGSAPATRETDLLNPLNMVQNVHAVVLSGGSVYGLAAADGVVRRLSENGYGFPLEKGHTAPIVPAACIYDLGRGPSYIPPISAEWGKKAYAAASDGPVSTGNMGAGTGALSGNMAAPIKGGLGVYGVTFASGLKIAALIVVNSFGSVINPYTGLFWEKPEALSDEAPVLPPETKKEEPAPGPMKNTTIGVVATNAILTKSQATKVAGFAQNGLARAIRPAHTYFDGDTIFVLATGEIPLSETRSFFDHTAAAGVNTLGEEAAKITAQAIANAILSAESTGGYVAYKDLKQR